ncbi:transmembrane protein 216-like isoform X1 [Antennarius striatus]|uniref:transmembrane protein 216-like isoform X1 n=1 Tax=Antennarius striatus TaxID=241820 RepID=UPI0035AEC22B
MSSSTRLPRRSSVALQVLLLLNSVYFAAFYLAEILMFLYKGVWVSMLQPIRTRFRFLYKGVWVSMLQPIRTRFRFLYKGILLPYPSHTLVLDVVLLLLFLGLETLRIFYGWRGNLCERSLASCVSLFLLGACASLAVYYLLLQTFVLRLEVVLSAVLLCFYSLEFLLGGFSVLAFSRSKVF